MAIHIIVATEHSPVQPGQKVEPVGNRMTLATENLPSGLPQVSFI